MANRRQIVGGKKNCSKCGEFKSLEEFGAYKTGPQAGIRYSVCRLCKREQGRIWRQDKKKVRNSSLKHYYGITLEEYEDLLRQQGGVCAICQEASSRVSFDVDHCHNSLQIRGLLCPNCNKALGLLKDDPHILQRAISYLKKEEICHDEKVSEG